jgi:hypothetical protein
MYRFRLLGFLLACLIASGAVGDAAISHLKVRVHVRVTGIPLNDVTISCGAFGAGPPPHIPGARFLSHVYTAPTAPVQWEDLTVPIPAAAFFVGCWPSTSLASGLNKRLTTSMVSARFARPLPNQPIVMAPITVVGNNP